MTNFSNRHPVDRLGEVRDQIRQLEDEEKELRATVLANPGDLAGAEYRANVRRHTQTKFDYTAARKALGRTLDPFTREITVTALRVSQR